MDLILLPKWDKEKFGEKGIVRWLKKEGEDVTKGEQIAEVETNNVYLAVEAPESGVLEQITLAHGEAATPGLMIGWVHDATSEPPDEGLEDSDPIR